MGILSSTKMIHNTVPYLYRNSIKICLILFLFPVYTINAQVYYSGPKVEKSDYIVFLKSDKKTNNAKTAGKIKKVTAKYKKKLFHKRYFLKAINGKRIYPNETDSVYRVYGFNNSDTLKAIAHEGIWLFKTISGEIEGYNLQPLPLSSLSNYFKKGNSRFYKNNHYFKKYVMKEWVQNDPETLALWHKSKKRMFFKRLIIPPLIASFVATPVGMALIAVPGFNTPKIAKVYNARMILKKRTQNEFFPE